MRETPPTPGKLTLQQETSLYRQLLECLEEEWQALISSKEEAILALAGRKVEILEHLTLAHPKERQEDLASPGDESLYLLKRQAATAQARNHRLIGAALEAIQDFLTHLNLAPPGTYQSAGKVENPQAPSFFHRQA